MTAGSDGILATVLKRDRVIIIAALGAITLLAWAYLLHLNAAMPAPATPDMAGGQMEGRSTGGMMQPDIAVWSATHFLAVFAMWAIMMIGMMTPSVTPTILIYAGVARRNREQGAPFAPAAWFAGGYFIAWILFALAASLGQYGLDRAAFLSPMMATSSPALGGAILIAAGLYQWTPLKESCLSRCAAPLQFIQQHGGFQQSAIGSLRLGVQHGLYCVGCCWVLMTLLFVTGVMNLFWIAALMLVVLAEKVVPRWPLLSRALGIGAIAGGIALILVR